MTPKEHRHRMKDISIDHHYNGQPVWLRRCLDADCGHETIGR